MAYIRLKLISGRFYAYLVESNYVPEKKSPRQIVLAYLGPVDKDDVLTVDTVNYVFSRDNHSCKKCSTTEKLTIDHILSKLDGGKNTENNLQVLCAKCNSSAGRRRPRI